jgi:hypothetical protein
LRSRREARLSKRCKVQHKRRAIAADAPQPCTLDSQTVFVFRNAPDDKPVIAYAFARHYLTLVNRPTDERSHVRRLSGREFRVSLVTFDEQVQQAYAAKQTPLPTVAGSRLASHLTNKARRAGSLCVNQSRRRCFPKFRQAYFAGSPSPAA